MTLLHHHLPVKVM